MEQIAKTIARLNPFDKPLKINGNLLSKKTDFIEYASKPSVQSMFLFIANARNILMFNAPLFDVEIACSNSIEINWPERYSPAPSDYAPVLLDVWESDIGRSAVVTQEFVDINEPIQEWYQFLKTQTGLLEPQGLVDALFDIELDNSDLKSLSQDKGRLTDAVFDLVMTRKNVELGTMPEPTPATPNKRQL